MDFNYQVSVHTLESLPGMNQKLAPIHRGQGETEERG